MQRAQRSRVGITGAGAVLALALTTAPARAQYEWTSGRPDGHAPIGVMGDHTHERGETMLSYRYTRMSMADNRSGTDLVSTAGVLDDFMVSPLDMTMTMHMAGFMYAPTDAVTLMAMFNWTDNTMNHVTRTNLPFTAESSGIGDAGIAALIGLKREGPRRVHLNAGLSIPTGSIEETGPNPTSMGNAVQMPYPMQLGSGTWDVVPGITVLGMSESASWGFQAKGTLRLGQNHRGWTAGDVAEGTGWFALEVMERLSVSARVLAKRWGDHEGHDAAFTNPTMAPTIREELRGGTRVDVPLGFNYYFPDGALAGHRLAAEWHVPLYQSLNGPQLETDWVLTVGLKMSFAALGG